MNLDRQILALLQEEGREHVPASELTQRLQVPQDLLTAHIEEMRALGYEITLSPHLGYALERTPDILHADSIQALLQPDSIVGNSVRVFAETSSTSDVVETLARAGTPEGAVVFAESQTRGRGRLGRKWISPAGEGLWFSVLLRPKLAPALATQFTIAAAVAAVRAVKFCTQLRPQIKWPNDLLLNGKKFAGILTELQAEPEQIRYLILGIGIDVNCMMFPGELKEIATSLRLESGEKVDRVKLAGTLLQELDRAYAAIRGNAFEKLAQEWESLCTTLGREIALDTGARVLRGHAEALDADGSLLIRTEHGRLERAVGGELRVV